MEVPRDVSALDAEATLQTAVLLNRVEDWAALLSHPYVVVLGEAGTGKSTEFQLQSRFLDAHGHFAFFVEISELAASGLTSALDVQGLDRLSEWQRSDAPAVFFLDSLDEAKLRSQSLQQALRNLQKLLQEQWDRVRLVVSCRASDWMAEADRVTLEVVAPSWIPAVHVVQLAPLVSQQVERLAEAAGVADVEEFMSAVARNHAQTFIERPLDVQWLGSYWVRHRRIGSLRELIADNVREKLKERPGRPSTLPPLDAEAGLQTLAGVAMINNSWAFIVPEESLVVQRSTDAIEPQDFLRDWAQVKVAELLRRPVFDESSYGRVRLHHRSVQEFLAAKWLLELVMKGLSQSRILELFFRGEPGAQAIPAHLGPVAAWLALWVAPLRRVLIDEAPVLLLAYGDPSGLAPEEREDILVSYAKSYGDRSRRYDRFDQAALQRFSSPLLANQIDELLSSPTTPGELSSTVLQIVAHGHLTACADRCVKLALDASRSAEVRASALEAGVTVGTDEHRAALLKLLQTTSLWDHTVAAAFIRGLYPHVLDCRGLVQLLEKVKPERRNLTTSLRFVLEYEIPHVGSVRQRLTLLDTVIELVWKPAAAADAYGVPSSQEWLLPMVATLAASILDDASLNTEMPPTGIVTALDIFRWCNVHGLHVWHGLDTMRKAVANHAGIRRYLFWRSVEARREKDGRTPTRHFLVHDSYELADLDATDAQWLAVDARARPDVRERLLAFDALCTLSSQGKANSIDRVFIQEVAEADPALSRRWKRMSNPPVSLAHYSHKSWQLKWKARDLADARRNATNRAELEKCIERIRAGTHTSALVFLYQQAGHSSSSYGEASSEPLEAKFGASIARAAVSGWRAFWRNVDPQPPHERDQPYATPLAVIVGLLGIRLDFENGLQASSLTSEEARTAARYAACELNSFPSWLTALAVAHPTIVGESLASAVLADLGQPEDGTPALGTLGKLPRADPVVRNLLSPYIAKQLRAEEPPRVDAIKDALDVILAEGALALDDFALLARERALAATRDPIRFAAWWDALLSVASVDAVELLEQVLDGVTREVAYELVLHVCHRIHDRTEVYARRPFRSSREPVVLQRLIPLIYEHIRLDDDVDHEGVYSPGPRDHAQRVRGQLVSWLAQAPGDDAATSLRKLADDPRLTAVREWLLHRADQRLVADAAVAGSEIVAALTEVCRSHGTRASENLVTLAEEKVMVKILFLGANPSNSTRLALGDEIREIGQKLRAAEERESFELSSRWAVRPSDLQQALLEVEPTIVHFSGHGDGVPGLVLHSDDAGEDALVTAAALASLFRILKDNVRLVVLNACFSEEQALAIVGEVDFVVGMGGEIGDDAARFFAAAFYRGLAFGKTIQKSFDLAVNELQLNGFGDDVLVPQLLARGGMDPGTTTLA